MESLQRIEFVGRRVLAGGSAGSDTMHTIHSLQRNDIGDAGVAALAQALNSTSLRTL